MLSALTIQVPGYLLGDELGEGWTSQTTLKITCSYAFCDSSAKQAKF